MEIVEAINVRQVDQQTIDTLKDLLDKAVSGELRSIMYVDKYRDGKCGHGWAGQPDMQMIGELENVKFNIFSMMYFPTQEE